MFKLLVLSAVVAVAVSKPQVHQTAMSYSSPDGSHSSTFVANNSPAGSSMSSSSSSSSPFGNFVSNTAHSMASPAMSYGGVYSYPHSAPVASTYSSGFASNQENRFTGSSSYTGQDFHNGFNNGYDYLNGHQYQNENDFFNRPNEIGFY